MKNIIKLTISLMIISSLGYSQVNEYYFMQPAGSYVALSSETTLWSGTFDNDTATLSIPSFTINGIAYTSMTVSSNGFITFGGTKPSSSLATPISGTTAYHAAVSAFGVNLQNAASGSPKVSYNTSDNGEIVVQWQDVKRNSATGDVASFQIRLNPSNSNISIVYGSVTTTYSGTSYGVQVGLRGSLNSDYNNRTTTTSWASTTAGTANSATCRFNNTVFPASGLVFSWKPLYNPLNFNTTAVSLNQIDLSWQKNSLNQNVMLAFNTVNTFGTPNHAQVYSAGNTINGGGTVLFYGDGTSFSHTSLSANTAYYYKIWSYDTVPDYSPGVTSNTRTAIALPYSQVFASTTEPVEWVMDMASENLHGIAGSYGITDQLYSSDTSGYAISPLLGSITYNSYLSFFYRYVDELGWPLNATTLGPDDKMEIQVSLDDGDNFTTIHTINQGNHNPTTEFTNISLPLSAYLGDFIKIRFLCKYGSGNYNIDIDNFIIEDGNNMSYAGAINDHPNLSNVGINTTDNEIIRLKVITQKSNNPLSMTSITFSTAGSTSATNDIGAAKVYYTTTPVFSATAQFGATYNNPPAGSFTVTGSQALAQGNNYFWLAYDIKSTATAGNVVDAQCTGFITSESGNAKTPTTPDPALNRKIGAVFSGTKTISASGDYTSLAAAVTALNNGVVGPGGVTFNIAGGHTENTTAAIVLTATGSASNPILFHKSGSGNNPLITRTDAGGVNTTALGNHGDGVIIIEGSDYVTFDSVDVAATQSTIEYGYYLRKASFTNGCSHVTVKNASITMTKGTSIYVIGICAANNSSSASNIAITTTGGIHRDIQFTGNTVGNVFTGIFAKGDDVIFDQNLTIGAEGAGNIIQNYAGYGTADAHGIYIFDVNNAMISYNTINNSAGGGSNFTAAAYGINNMSANGLSFYALNNTINLSTQTATLNHILCGIHSRVNGDIQIDYNTITLNNSTSTNQIFYYIFNEIYNSSSASYSISHNTFQGSTLLHTGSIYLISNSNTQTSPAIATIMYNAVNGTITRNASTGSFYLYHNSGNNSATEIIAENNFSNISQSGTSYFYGINSTQVSNTHQVYNNTISNITSGTNTFTAMSLTGSSTRNIYGNEISNITTGGPVTTINIGSGSSVCKIYNNLITNITTTSTQLTNPLFSGILVTSGTNVYLYNNFISDLKATAAGASDAIRAVSITSSQANSTIGVYNNSIYLNAASSGATFGTSCIYHVSNSTATTAQLDLRNNILINKSTPNGSNGKAIVIRRDISNLANFSTLSDNNILYAGTPGTNRLIYQDANGYQTLAAYQAYVTPREANSFTEDPPFMNVTTAPFDLHMQTTVPTLAESAGQPMTTPVSIGTDYDGDTRQPAPDIGADEFAGISGFVDNPASFTAMPLGSQQNRLSFTLNEDADDVVIIFDNNNTFTPPAGTPVVGQPLGGGTVIYVGDQSPFDHNGLTMGTAYFYKAFSYNGSSFSLGLTGNATPGVYPVTNLNAAASGQTLIELAWTKNNAGNDVIVASHNAYMDGSLVNGTVYNAGDAVPSGGTIIYKGPASSYDHTGLSEWTQYYYKVWSYDAFNYYSSGSSVNEVTYSNPVVALPYLTNFSGTWAHTPSAPPQWKVVDVGGTGYYSWVRYTLNYYSAPACVRGYETDVADDYLISPPIILPGQNIQISWFDKVSSSSSNNSYKVLLSNTDNKISSFTAELGDFNCTNTDWTLHTINLNAYQGQTVFIAFKHYYSQSQYQYFTLDDILVETMVPGEASLVFPKNNLLTYVNPLLQWTAPASSIPILGYKVYMDSNPDPATLVYDGTNTSFQTSGIPNNTSRYWKVVPYNSNGEAVNVPVWSFSTVRAAQLAESFEADYFPPVSWSQDFGWMYSVSSVFHGLHSAIKGTNGTANKLITPLLDINTGDKLEFFCGTSSSNTVRIQLMYSLNKTTWTNFGDPIVVPVAAWGLNSIDLSALAGNDFYLAFGAYNVSGGSTFNVFLDHVTGPDVVPVIPATATNPFPLNGDTFIPTGPLMEWDPVIWGGIPSGYKVYMGTDPNPASLVYNGPNESYQAGPLQINTTYYWKVIPYNSAGDASNCPVWSFTTVPQGGVQLGRDTEVYLDLPIHPDYNYSYTQTIYLQPDIEIAGSRITKLYYQWNGGEEGVNYKDWVIFMGHTNKTEFTGTSDWIPIGQLTQVFNGEVNIPAQEGWIEIILEIPFTYNNTDNLVIAVDENTAGFADAAFVSFYGTYSDDSRGIKYYDDDTNPDPASPPLADYLVDGFANIRLMLEPAPTTPLLRILPDSKDFGPYPYGYETSPQVFKIQNYGVGSLTINSVGKTGADASQFVLTDGNSYPVNLTANQFITVSATFYPSTEGPKSASLSIVHDQAGSPGIAPLTGTGLNPLITSFPFEETFEDNSATRVIWTQLQETGSSYWTYASGAGDGSITTAHTGTKNARFTGTSEINITKLISPVFDLTGVINPRLIFWYGQEEWSGDQNELKVYYRIASDQPWSMILHDLSNRISWTSDTLDLPNPSATYQLAFEGIDDYGYPNVLDDIFVGNAGPPSTTWTGSISDSWTNPANWTDGVPTANHAVIIDSQNYDPEVATTITIFSLTIQPGSVITITPSGELTVTGD